MKTIAGAMMGLSGETGKTGEGMPLSGRMGDQQLSPFGRNKLRTRELSARRPRESESEPLIRPARLVRLGGGRLIHGERENRSFRRTETVRSRRCIVSARTMSSSVLLFHGFGL